jgi:hypothetical protein
MTVPQQKRQYRSSSATSQRITVGTAADVVIAAQDSRCYLAVQLLSAAGSLIVARASSTVDPDSGSTRGFLLDAAPEAGKAGGFWECDTYTGPVALRAVGDTVTIAIEEVL